MRPVYKSRVNYVQLPPYQYRRQTYSILYGHGYWEGSPLVSKTPNTRIACQEVLSGWSGKKSQDHPCYHLKETFKYDTFTWGKGPRIGGSLDPESHSGFSFSAYAEEGSNATSIGGVSIVPGAPYAFGPPLNWRKAYEALLDDVNGLMPAQKSLAVNIAEYTQLKRLVPSISKSIKRILAWMRREPNRILKVRYRRGHSRYSDIHYKTVSVSSGAWCLRDLAELHLANAFGVQPLAQDLGELSAKYWEAKLHLDWYRRISNGEVHKVHSSVETNAHRETTVTGGPVNMRITELQDSTSKGTLSASVRIKPLSNETQQKRLFNQILGVNVPLQIAWELVPFSFVVDWFIPVGDVLSMFEPKRFFGSLAAEVTFLSRVCSVKTVCTTTRKIDVLYKVAQKAPYWGRRGLFQIVDPGSCTRKRTEYDRQTSWPDFNIMPPKGHYGISQVGLTLSLVVTRLFKR